MGGGVIPKEDDKEGKNPTEEKEANKTSKKKDKKAKVREYDPNKDDACLMIGGYSSYIKKKEIAAQSD